MRDHRGFNRTCRHRPDWRTLRVAISQYASSARVRQPGGAAVRGSTGEGVYAENRSTRRSTIEIWSAREDHDSGREQRISSFRSSAPEAAPFTGDRSRALNLIADWVQKGNSPFQSSVGAYQLAAPTRRTTDGLPWSETFDAAEPMGRDRRGRRAGLQRHGTAPVRAPPARSSSWYAPGARRCATRSQWAELPVSGPALAIASPSVAGRVGAARPAARARRSQRRAERANADRLSPRSRAGEVAHAKLVNRGVSEGRRRRVAARRRPKPCAGG
jgi:hypothetical protein